MRTLNTGQIAILKTLYKFRFGTAPLLTQTLELSSRTSINARLDVLVNHGYIGKRYDKSYKLLGKPASYFLLPKAFPILKEQKNVSPKVLKNIYKDRNAADRFTNNCLDVLAVRNGLKAQYGENLKLFTKSQVSCFPYFPDSLPDAYARLNLEGKEQQFFLYFLHDNQPFYMHINKIKEYIEYADDEQWSKNTKTKLPSFLAICDSSAVQRRLHAHMVKLADTSWEEDIRFASTTKGGLVSSDKTVWQLAGRPEEQFTLGSI